MLQKVVGLFGTCGESKWREEIVIPKLEAAGFAYFNPVVKEWNEQAQKNEIEHATSDQVILMVITGETTGIASMAELGWQVLSALEKGQKIVVCLEDMPNDVKDEFGNSLRINKARSLIRKYIANSKAATVFLANSIEEATDKAIELMG